ncbi:hypothetical protein V8F20_002195 [Naviculisporaceae sp. PSN 640]
MLLAESVLAQSTDNGCMCRYSIRIGAYGTCIHVHRVLNLRWRYPHSNYDYACSITNYGVIFGTGRTGYGKDNWHGDRNCTPSPGSAKAGRRAATSGAGVAGSGHFHGWVNGSKDVVLAMWEGHRGRGMDARNFGISSGTGYRPKPNQTGMGHVGRKGSNQEQRHGFTGKEVTAHSDDSSEVRMTGGVARRLPSLAVRGC